MLQGESSLEMFRISLERLGFRGLGFREFGTHIRRRLGGTSLGGWAGDGWGEGEGFWRDWGRLRG